MINLIYSDLIKRYEKILTSTSRGFDTNHEFLESWVPSTNINQSISDLINAAFDYNIKKMEIIFSKEENSSLEFDKLKKKIFKLPHNGISRQ